MIQHIGTLKQTENFAFKQLGTYLKTSHVTLMGRAANYWQDIALSGNLRFVDGH